MLRVLPKGFHLTPFFATQRSSNKKKEVGIYNLGGLSPFLQYLLAREALSLILVWMAGFEPATSGFQSPHADQTALHPVMNSSIKNQLFLGHKYNWQNLMEANVSLVDYIGLLVIKNLWIEYDTGFAVHVNRVINYC